MVPGSGTRLAAGAARYSANPDGISGFTPITFRPAQTWAWPARQRGHRPQPMTGFTATSWPARSPPAALAEVPASMLAAGPPGRA